jgi:hypothetical protein
MAFTRLRKFLLPALAGLALITGPSWAEPAPFPDEAYFNMDNAFALTYVTNGMSNGPAVRALKRTSRPHGVTVNCFSALTINSFRWQEQH